MDLRDHPDDGVVLRARALVVMTADVVVIGAGFAGLSAAVRLADAGLTVVVAEEAPRLGGRAAAFLDRETGERVDNGQHVLFGCYHDTYAFLRRLGTDGLVPLDRRLELSMVGMDGRGARLACPAWPAPWHLLAGVLGWRALPLRDRLSSLWLVSLLATVRRHGAAAAAERVPADQTLSAWLGARRQSARLSEWLWHPLAIAALNQSPDTAAASSFVRVLGELFGPRLEDSAVGLPRVPLDELYADPASRLLATLGGTVLVKSPARISLDPDGHITSVRAGSTIVRTSRVVSTVPWHALGRIWDGGVPAALAPVVSRAESMASSPIVTANLWFDRPVMPQRFVGLIGGRMHWAFDKSAIFGRGTGHVSMVSSGASGLVSMDNSAVTALAERDLRRALPSARGARLVRSVIVREHRATFSLAPDAPRRPSVGTALPGLYLAGDWTDTGLPGTVESAVRSGHRAAEAALGDVRRAVPAMLP